MPPAPTPSSAASAPSRPATAARSSASGRRAPRRASTLRVGDARPRLADAGLRRPRRRRSRPRPATTTPTCVDGIALPDPAIALAAATACAGRSRRARPGGVRVDRRRLRRRAALRDAVLYELHVGTFTREGTFDAAIPHLRGLRELGVTADRADAGRRVPRRATAGATTASTSPPRSPPTAGPHGLQRLVDAAHAAGLGGAARRRLQPRRRLRRAGAGGVRPVLHRAATRRRGARRSTTTTRDSRRRARVGAAERRAVDPRLPPRRPAARRDPRDLRLRARAPRRRDRAPRARGQPARARDRRVRPQRPEGHAPAERGGWGCDAAWADDFHHALRVAAHRRHARATTRSSARSRTLAKAFHRPHVHDGDYSTFRRRRFGAPADDVAARARSSSSRPTTTRSATARSATGCPSRCGRSPRSARFCHRSRRCSSRARSTASARRSSSSPTTSTRRSPTRRARAAGASSPPSPRSPARRSPTRRTPATFARSKLTREGEPERPARALRARCSRRARELPPATPTPIAFDERRAAGCASRRGAVQMLANFSQRAVHVPLERAAELVLATHHADARAGLRGPAGPCPERCAADGGLARTARSRSAPPGMARGRTSRCSRRTPSASSCACSTTTTARTRVELTERTAFHWHGYLPGSAPASATATASTAPTTRRTGTGSTRTSC